MNKKTAVGVILVATPMFAAAVCLPQNKKTAEAMPAPYTPSGTDAYETVPLTESALRMEKESVSFDIKDFPEIGEITQTDYNARVTTQYELINPTEEDLTVRFAYPIGEYAEYTADYLSDKEDFRCGLSRYFVKVDGEDVECRLRYSYFSHYQTDIDDCIKKFKGVSSSFFDPQMQVTKYSFAQNDRGIVYDGDKLLRVLCNYNPQKTRIFSPHSYSYYLEDGKATICFRADETPSIYVIGGDAVFSAFLDSESEQEGIAESAVVQEEALGTLGNFVASFNRSEWISDDDWFTCYTDYLESCCTNYGLIGCGCELYESSLFRWLDYTLTVPAGGSIVHSVSAPLFPSLTSQNTYSYQYNLSPARLWSSYGEVEIQIDTSYYLTGSSLGFTESDGVYKFSRNSLPLGELTFVVTTEAPSASPFTPFSKTPSALIVALIMLGTEITVAAVIITVILCVNRKKAKQHTEGEFTYMGTAEQGKIDSRNQDDNHSG